MWTKHKSTGYPEVKTLPGTRKLHCARSKGRDLHLDVLLLSCYCEGCRQGTHCKDKEHTTPWEPKQLQIQKQLSIPNTSTISRCITSTSAMSITSNSTSSLSTASCIPEIEDFVAVKLCGATSKSVHLYMAELLDIMQNKEKAHMRFMKKCGNDFYLWPTPEDESRKSIDSIICVVGFPKLVNMREQFRFTAEDMARVKRHAQGFN